jgi:hypothetical protein
MKKCKCNGYGMFARADLPYDDYYPCPFCNNYKFKKWRKQHPELNEKIWGPINANQKNLY